MDLVRIRLSVAERLDQELKAAGLRSFVDPAYKVGIVRHIVLFRYKSSVSKEERREITGRFLGLRESLRNGAPYIVSIEEGMQSSGEGADGGLEHAFMVTFSSEGDRNYYVGEPIIDDSDFYDPAHQVFRKFVEPFLDVKGVLVFDYAVTQTTP